jgi:hypothetical protein
MKRFESVEANTTLRKMDDVEPGRERRMAGYRNKKLASRLLLIRNEAFQGNPSYRIYFSACIQFSGFYSFDFCSYSCRDTSSHHPFLYPEYAAV